MSCLLVALPPDQSHPITSSIRCEARINKTEKEKLNFLQTETAEARVGENQRVVKT